MTAQRLRIVGVMGSSTEPHTELARPVGRIIAQLGCHLLTGGGSGVMEEVCKAFCRTKPRKGLSIGILKGRLQIESTGERQRFLLAPSPPNKWVELPVYTHLPLSGPRGRDERSRNHINVINPDVLVALPGQAGTYSEVTLRLDYGRRVILFLGGHDIAGHPAAHFLSLATARGQVQIAGSPDELEALIRGSLIPGNDVLRKANRRIAHRPVTARNPSRGAIAR